jgi:hypothetical protein
VTITAGEETYQVTAHPPDSDQKGASFGWVKALIAAKAGTS